MDLHQSTNQQFNNLMTNRINPNVNISNSVNQRHPNAIQRVKSLQINSPINNRSDMNSFNNYYDVQNRSMINSNTIYPNQVNSSMASQICNKPYPMNVGMIPNPVKPQINHPSKIMINSNQLLDDNLIKQNNPQMIFKQMNLVNGSSSLPPMYSINYQGSINAARNDAVNYSTVNKNAQVINNSLANDVSYSKPVNCLNNNNQSSLQNYFGPNNQLNYQSAISNNDSLISYCSSYVGPQLNNQQIEEHLNNDYYSKSTVLLNRAAENLTKSSQNFSSNCGQESIILYSPPQQINNQLNSFNNQVLNKLDNNRSQFTTNNNHQQVVSKNEIYQNQINSFINTENISNSNSRIVNSTVEPFSAVNQPLQDYFSPGFECITIKEKKVCANCKTNQTTMWRKNENNDSLCNPCGLYLKVHKTNRPIKMHKKHIHTRRRNKKTPINLINLMNGELININDGQYCNLTAVQIPFNVVENFKVLDNTNVSNSIIYEMNPNDATRISNNSNESALSEKVDVQEVNLNDAGYKSGSQSSQISPS